MRNIFEDPIPDKKAKYPRLSLFIVVIFCFAGLAGAVFAFEYVASQTKIPLTWATAKLHHLKTYDAEPVDVLFMGTSVIFRDVDTAYLNEQANANQCSTSFFNAAIPGMSTAEFKLFLEQVKANPKLKPDYIAFCPCLFSPLNNLQSDRRFRSNSLANLEINLLHLAADEVSGKELRDFQFHTLKRAFNTSRGSVWLASDANRYGESPSVLTRDPDEPVDREALQSLDEAGLSGQGCMPSYWRERTRDWPYLKESDSFREVFGVGSDISLGEAINAANSDGGRDSSLQRQAVAGLLNALSLKEYKYAAADVLEITQEGYETEKYNKFRNELLVENRLFCPLAPDVHYRSIRQKEAYSQGLESAGFISLDLDPSLGDEDARHLQFLNNENKQEKLQKDIRRIANNVDKFEDFEASFNEDQKRLFDTYIELIRATGAEPILIYPPLLTLHPSRAYYLETYPELPHIVADETISAFAQLEYWYDETHLSLAGARAFSDIAYEQFCPQTETQ